MPKFKEYNQSQAVLRQLVPAQLLEDDHPARIVDAVVERLNLDRIYDCYKEEGKPAYHPKMMLKVLFYSYLIGNMSCRKMKNGLEIRADYVFLSGDQVPDFRTLNAFRTRHIAELPGLFTQIVALCAALGMIDFKKLAIDGQKIPANANFRNNVDRARAKKNLDRIRKGMQKLVEQEPNEALMQETIDERNRRLKRKEARLIQTLAVLESFEDEKASLNMTDADAKTMSHKDRRILPSYNQQSAVDGMYGVTCAVATTQKGDEPGDLFALVDAAKENAGDTFEAVLADSGFADFETHRAMEEDREETFFVPDKRQQVIDSGEAARGDYDKSKFRSNDDGTSMTCPQGKAMRLRYEKHFDDGHTERIFVGNGCDKCPVQSACTKSKNGSRSVSYDSREEFRTIMRERLRSTAGSEMYRHRQGIVESTHGHDQKNLGWRQHHLRGLSKAALEFLLLRLAGNIGKIARYKAQDFLAMVKDKGHCMAGALG
jgi:transposase